MILPIIAYGANILRKDCIDLDVKYADLSTLISNMYETMYQAHGVGLAAPQINKSLRLFIIDTHPFLDEENPKFVPVKKTFINPRIISKSGDLWVFNEGCLSIPDVREDVIRESIVEIEYLDENFNSCNEKFDGLNARVILHEYDHIEGRLFTDMISPLRKRMVKGKLKDISNGKFEPNYKMKVLR